jgi:glycosyltransferase involved in cell wall biosynthesis
MTAELTTALPQIGAAATRPAHEAPWLAAQPLPLRVLFYSFFPGGGIGRYTHELVTRLARLPGVEAELACLPNFEWLAAAKYPVWPGLFGISDARALKRRSRFLLAQFINPWRLLGRAGATQAKIVHLSNINHFSYPFWSRLPRDRALKIVATVHDVKREKPILWRRYEEGQLAAFYRRADALFVHSQAQSAQLQEFSRVAPNRIHLVPHGPYDAGRPSAAPDILRARLGLPAGQRIALFFGALRDDKNLELLLRVWPRFRDRQHLVIAGRGDGGRHKPVSWYRALVRELNIENSVTFLDRYIPEREVPDLFAACDWVALPYRGSFTSQSGVLNVAVCYDRPVVASGAGTFAETLARFDLGLAVTPDDAGALAAGIEALTRRLDGKHLHAFDRYRQENSWETAARQTAEVYRSLLDEPIPGHPA